MFSLLFFRNKLLFEVFFGIFLSHRIYAIIIIIIIMWRDNHNDKCQFCLFLFFLSDRFFSFIFLVDQKVSFKDSIIIIIMVWWTFFFGHLFECLLSNGDGYFDQMMTMMILVFSWLSHLKNCFFPVEKR